ncbi:hypothetical protein Tco_0047909 [Tanacetum coccineum]
MRIRVCGFEASNQARLGIYPSYNGVNATFVGKIRGADPTPYVIVLSVQEAEFCMSPPIHRKYKNSIAIATGCKRFKKTKRSNRKIRNPCLMALPKLKRTCSGRRIWTNGCGKVETKIIAKDGTITKVPGKFKSYETSDEETEEQPRRRDLYRFVDHPQIQQANPMNEYAPHQIPQPLVRPVGGKNDKDDHGYASHPCPWCSK